MPLAFRAHWRNCYASDDVSALMDADIRAIDALEDALQPLDEDTAHIRQLITCFESCHHRALRHAEIISAAIAAGHTDKGPGRRPGGSRHPAEEIWQNACTALRAWVQGRPGMASGLKIGNLSAEQLLSGLGLWSPLKAWQVSKVADKIAQYLDPATMWRGYSVFAEPAGAREAKFLAATRAARIHDTVGGEPAEIGLAVVIDGLEACCWSFASNLFVVLEAIGGEPQARTPLALCARNIKLAPIRPRMAVMANTPYAWSCEEPPGGPLVDRQLLDTLGPRTPTKAWLAASFAKTIRLQLDL